MSLNPRTRRMVGGALGALGALAALALMADPTDDAAAPAARADAPTAGEATAHREPPRGGSGFESSFDVELSAESSAVGLASAYVADQLLVRPADGVHLDALARSVGAEVLRGPGRSGFAALRVPSGTAGATLAQLQASGAITAVAPMGRVVGTASADAAATCAASWRVRPAHDAQWHLERIRANEPGNADLSGVVVAVLDTGVAVTPTLVDAPIVSPYDFVHDDADASDDHQHGTHIASIIASSGVVEGVAPGVSLMPLKVLDADNTGSEWMLVEALYHAADHGADVVNMSLAFPEGYTPSGALRDALQYAAEAGVVLVSASGNNGVAEVAYPAAAPQVIAVGASRMDGAGVTAADYSNIGPKVDLMAPGGDMTRDEDADGVPDGIVAETILPGDPSASGLFLFAGTSQAAAQVSGAAAWLVAAGASADEVRAQLQNRARDRGFDFSEGTGAGELDVKRSWRSACTDRMDGYDADAYSVAVLPRLQRDGDAVTARAQLALLDSAGEPVKGYRVFVNLTGSSTGILDCKTDRDGVCTVTAPSVDTATEGEALAWAFRAEAVVKKDISHQPAAALFGSAAFEAVLAELGNRGDLDGALVAFYDDGSAADAAPAYTFVDMGAGLSSSPLGIVATPAALSPLATPGDLSADAAALDGTGLSSSPLGVLQPTVLTLTVDGAGLSSSPLGLVLGGIPDPTAADLGGSGLSSSPLGFTGTLDLLVFDNAPAIDADADLSGTGLSSSPLGFTGPGLLDPTLSGASEPILMGASAGGGAALDGTATGAWLAEGGFVTDAGYPVASLLVASAVVEVPAEATSLMPTGAGVEAYE